MQFWEALYAAAKSRSVPTTHIGPKLGMSKEYVANGKSRSVDTSIGRCIKLLETVGYSLWIVPDEEDMPDNAMKVDIV